jgi:hypothetical protein
MKLPKIEAVAGVKIQKDIPSHGQEASPQKPFPSKEAQKISSKTQSAVPERLAGDKGASPQVSGAEDFVVEINRSHRQTEPSLLPDQAPGTERGAANKSASSSPWRISGGGKAAAAYLSPPTEGTAPKTAWEQLYAAIKEILEHEPKGSPLFRALHNTLRMWRSLVYKETDLGNVDFFRSFLMKTERNPMQVISKPIQASEHPQNADTIKTDTLTSLLEELILFAGQSRGTKETAPLIQKLLESASILKESLESANLLNGLTYSTRGELCFTIPFHFNTHFLTGYLYLKLNPDRSDRKKREGGDMFVVFFLDLPDLGGVRVDASLDRRNFLRLWVYMEKKEAVSFVQRRLPDLSNSFERLGFRTEYMTVKAVHRFKLEEAWGKELEPGLLKGRIDLLI